MKRFLCILICLSISACSNKAMNDATRSATQTEHSTTSHEQFRPLYHFTPEANWMNDPNGMVYYKGEYHLFYQYHPYSTVWGPMHWGHAVSKDLLHWQHLPVALTPDEHGTIFSGSIVVDHNNTSGLGSKDNPAMVALFTYNNEQRKKAGLQDFQTQGLAYSLDEGLSWTKYQANPVMPNPGIVDFRDPKVSWFAEQQKWVMAVTQGDHIGFYSSKNLLDWQFESTFGKGFGEHGGVWECPDLIRIKIAGTEEYKYLLLVSIVPGAPNGGSGTQYFVGDFDGKTFELDPQFAGQLEKHHAIWLDYGTDNYAGVTFANIPEKDGRSLFMGWMNNWNYATNVPTKTWRGAMTIPRSLHLKRTPSGFKVFSQPITEISTISRNSMEYKHIPVKESVDLKGLFGPLTSANRLQFTLNGPQSNHVQLVYSNKEQEQLIINLDTSSGTLNIDRRQSGLTDFHPEFADVQYGSLGANLTTYSFDIFYDGASVEIFVNDGELVMTALAYPSTPYDQIHLNVDQDVLLNSVRLTQLKNQIE